MVSTFNSITDHLRLVLTHVVILIKVINVIEVVDVVNLLELLDLLEFYDERTHTNLG